MMKVLCIMVAFMVIVPPYAEATFKNCGQVVSYLVPCTKYLKKGGDVSVACCDSLKGLKGAAKTSIDIRRACDCIVNYIYSSLPTPEYAVTLSDKCGVDIPYINPEFDCDNIQ